MFTAIDSQLNEALRDALVAYFLDEVVKGSSQLETLGLPETIKDANDLYQFLLLDVQVSQKVETSRVASAISSLQQYINAIFMGMEPGYENESLESSVVTHWREQQAQYPLWAASQQLAWYPEIYIDPSLRLKKTPYFQQLEQDINQNRINVDTVQEAVKSYLTKFERVANLHVVNGYVTSDKFGDGTYYFIGKARGETAYYWRSVDMSQRSFKEGADGPRMDNPQPGAWTTWEQADLPISENALGDTLRPVYFNNRLFVTWLEYQPSDNAALSVSPSANDTPTVESTSLVRMMMVYKKYDDSWSAPNACLTWYTNIAPQSLKTITVQDTATSLFLALYADYTPGAAEDGSADTYALLKTSSMDRNFNLTELFPASGEVPESDPGAVTKEIHVLKLGRLFAHINPQRLQFRVPPLDIRLKSVESFSPFPTSDEWNIDQLQGCVAEALESDVIYDQENATLEFHSKLSRSPEDFTTRLDISTWAPLGREGLVLKFVFDQDDPSPTHMKLLSGSTIEGNSGWRQEDASIDAYSFKQTDGVASPYLLCDSPLTERFTVVGTGRGPFPIHEKYVNRAAVREILKSSSLSGTSVLTRYTKGVEISSTTGRLNHHDRAGQTDFQHHIARPTSIRSKEAVWPQAYSQNRVSLGSASERGDLLPPDTLVLKLPINEETLRPDWGVTWPPVEQDGRFIPFMHGITVRKGRTLVGHAIKGVLVELQHLPLTSKTLIAPKINTRHSETLGTAEFIDFEGTDIGYSDGSDTEKRSPLRMNTLFARELTQKVDVALEYLLTWETQGLPEPPMNDSGDGKSATMDFHGANGQYFWELFLHMPFLIGHRLNLEHDFAQAERWYNFIFDPSRKADSATGRPAFWNVRPLVADQTSPGYATSAATDPDGIAMSHPIRYQKAIYRHYLQNLVDQGDAAYRQLTPDSLNEAKLWYVRVLEMLGNRPDVRLIDHWTPITLQELTSAPNPHLRSFELQLVQQDQLRLDSQKANGGQSAYRFEQPPLRLRTFSQDPTLSELDSPHFRVPINFKLVALWEGLESRLRNLRDNRTLDGKPLSPALYAAPLNPGEMLANLGQNASGSRGNRNLTLSTPHYRFAVMHPRANAAVETLIQFGHTLLSLIERKEQSELQELQHQQAWDFAQLAVDLQKQTLKVDQQNRAALLASRQVVEARLNFYSERSDEVVSAGEIAAGAAHLAGRHAETVSAVADVVGCALKTAPNHFGMIAGLANGVITGGWRLEGPAEMASSAAAGIAATLHGVGDALDRVEQYRRRHQEWMLARDQASLEVAQIDAQLAVLDEQTHISELQLHQAETALAQAKITYAFLGKRFTQSQLYQWLNGQLASFYYQAYDATLSLCLAAEACWQYEMADFSTRFIQTTAWNTTHRGLSVGESLKVDLLKMESAYLSRNDRLLEITKTVSLRQLLEKDPDSNVNEDWDTIHHRLRTQGNVDFELTQAMFDHDYPGQYCRRIARVSVSLPVTLGPYEDIRATLTQTYNKVELASVGINSVRENLRASQQIALSSGVDDDGMFTLNFDDDRYLPFEGTGAVSRWSLQFSNHATQQAALDSLTDIIVHVQYTAKPSEGV
jgi:hypothetical protein